MTIGSDDNNVLAGVSGDEAEDQDCLFSIGDLSSEFGISTRTIRFYESKGLLAPQRVGANRIYTKRDRARLIIILRGKRLGFSLEEISEYLALYEADPDHVVQIRHLLGKVEGMIGDLELKKQDVESTLRELESVRAQCVKGLRDLGG